MGCERVKLAVLQPPYPAEPTSESASLCLEWMLRSLSQLEPGEQDLVALPEYANVPGLEDATIARGFAEAEGSAFEEQVGREAARLECLIVIGTLAKSGSRWLNRTRLLGAATNAQYYDKTHLTDVETGSFGLTPGSEPVVHDVGGVRIGYAVCFDTYFSEYWSALALLQPDVVVCPSYQRSESGKRIRLTSQARALDTGCYVVRSSYALSGASTGGHSLVASPDGRILADAGITPGLIRAEIDPAAKFVKPRSYGQPAIEHRELTASHRRPEVYRPHLDRQRALQAAPYPQLCAHRGLSQACPENTLPAFAAALAYGVHELELDLWMSSDGVPVVCHDPNVDRTTDGTGRVTEMTWKDVQQLDAGVRLGEQWRDVRMPRFEQVLELVRGQATLNLHIKDAGPGGALVTVVCDLIRKYGLMRLAYIAGGSGSVLDTAKDYDPDIERACLAGQAVPSSQIGLAKQFDCRRIQFCRQVQVEDIRRAHEQGIICNMFYSDEADDAAEYVRMGVDVLLTNRANTLLEGGISQPVGENVVSRQ